MALYQLKIVYDGTDFLGFQKQRKGRTVQAEIETALQELGWNGKSIYSAGRTDTGVHASGQVISFDFETSLAKEKLQKALNAILPADVVIEDIQFAIKGFHPRFSAKERKYVYRLYCQEQRNPLLERFYWHIWPEVDFQLLKDAANLLLGEHDFRAFGRPPREESGTVRRILAAVWKRNETCFKFEVTGIAFLYHMVRRMVFLQVQTAQRRITIKDFQSAIDGDMGIKPGIAPARGLELCEVVY
jgi:tRNA pseudouridine38-40 synthase